MDNNNNSNHSNNLLNSQVGIPIAEPIMETLEKKDNPIPQAIPFTQINQLESTRPFSTSIPLTEVTNQINKANQINKPIIQGFQALPNGLLIPTITPVRNISSDGNCRDCGRIFIKDEIDQYNSSYYRCESCRKDFLTKNLIASCLIS